MPSFILEQPLNGWREEVRRGKKPKERSKNLPLPNDGILRQGQESRRLLHFKER